MQLLNKLTEGESRQAVTNLSQTYGLDEQTTKGLLENVLPEFSEAVARNTLSRGGIANIVDLLGRTNFQDYLSPNANLREADQAGIEALSEIFRTKSKSRVVAARASKKTGVPEKLIKAILPQIAAIVLGGISNQLQGGLQNLTTKIPESRRLAQFGSTGANVGQHQPLPMPSDEMLGGQSNSPRRGNPYGDLTDIIRRRGGKIGGQAPGNIIRDLLGQVLGFQNKGIFGWIVQFIIYRYAWTILRAIFGRLFFRR